MDILDEEILNLWRLLNSHNVAYIMVGGFATTLNGFNRNTADIDLWIKDTIPNRKNLRTVLKELELGDLDGIESSELIPGFTSITLNSGFELDLMTYVKGLEQEKFDECHKLAPIAEIEGVPVKFLHINHLIKAKKASGRPKDLIDVIELEKIRTFRK
ncbi:MAG: hypothetical protein H0W61_06780 [Bacteroidetes bacterium]|nr:hypothetical protein [Bacteroidota bacterium]